jgi:hypothetical protein
MRYYTTAFKSISKLNIKTSDEFNRNLSVIENAFLISKLSDVFEGIKKPTEEERQLAWNMLMTIFDPEARTVYIRELLNKNTTRPDPHVAWRLLKSGFQKNSACPITLT